MNNMKLAMMADDGKEIVYLSRNDYEVVTTEEIENTLIIDISKIDIKYKNSASTSGQIFSTFPILGFKVCFWVFVVWVFGFQSLKSTALPAVGISLSCNPFIWSWDSIWTFQILRQPSEVCHPQHLLDIFQEYKTII